MRSRKLATRQRRTRTAGAVAALPFVLLLLVLAPGLVSAQPQVPLNPGLIPKFVEPMPMPLRVDATATSLAAPLEISMNEFQQKVLPASFYLGLMPPYDAGTYLWSYQAAGHPQTFPGPTLEALTGVPTTVKYVNNLQGPGGAPPFLQSLIKVDQTLHWADPLAQHGSLLPYVGPVPAVPHLHGGEVPSAFDGGPDAWWTPGVLQTGPGFVTDTYTYPNEQEPATLWYHDHALGVTRTNVYAGLAGFYLLRDPGVEPSNLPGGPDDTPLDMYGNSYEREVVIQDRMFDTNGQLYFPSLGVNPLVHPFWLPEFFGDVVLVNGKSWPYLEVEPRRYRFRFLNGSNARFYELRLTDRATKTPGPAFWQIGSDGGFLDTPAMLNDPLAAKSPRLIIAPGERADVIIDFSAHAARTFTLVNSAKSPFPKGTPADPQTVGQIMQFRVGATVTGGADPSLDPAVTTSLRPVPIERPTPGAITRALTLNEKMGMGGPLEVFVNNTMWDMATTENSQVGDTEVWEVINLTADSHPIHLHLVQFQLLNRQAFNVNKYMSVYGMPMEGMGPPLPYDIPSAATGFKLGGNPDVAPYLQGPAKLPDPNETGWKDTFRMNPGEVTRVIVRIAPQGAQAMAGGPVTAGMNLFPFDPAAGVGVADDGFGYPGGPGYVWHCHIIDHEDNEMMRRFAIISTPAPGGPMPMTAAAPAPRTMLELMPGFPNPATDRATIRFALNQAASVDLRIFDVAGREVRALTQGSLDAGSHSVVWNARDAAGKEVPRGTYFYRVRAAGEVKSGKLMILP